MTDLMPRHNVPSLCTGNADRSILAGAILSRAAGDRFRAFSAGSYPQPIAVEALALLRAEGHDVGGLRSKGWDERCTLEHRRPVGGQRPPRARAGVRQAYRQLSELIAEFIATPVVRLDAVALKFQLVDGGAGS